VKHETSFLVQIRCDWFAWCESLLWLYYYEGKLQSLQEDGGTRQEILKQLAVKLELALLIYTKHNSKISIFKIQRGQRLPATPLRRPWRKWVPVGHSSHSKGTTTRVQKEHYFLTIKKQTFAKPFCYQFTFVFQ